jgi:ABC-type uncharacterized transport system substrate-binding protein
MRLKSRKVLPITANILLAILAESAFAEAATTFKIDSVTYVDVDSSNSDGNRKSIADLFARGSACQQKKFEYIKVGIQDRSAWRVALKRVDDRETSLVIVASGAIGKDAFSLLRRANIVFQTHADPVADDFVYALNLPGGRSTGVTYYASLRAKQLELLRDYNSRIARIGIVADLPFFETVMPKTERQALSNLFGVTLLPILAENANELRLHLRSEKIDAAIVPFALPAYQDGQAVASTLRAANIPTVYDRVSFLKYGATFAVEPFGMNGREEIAKAVSLVCRGISPAGIPVARYRYLRYAVSIKEAQRLQGKIEANFWRLFDAILE